MSLNQPRKINSKEARNSIPDYIEGDILFDLNLMGIQVEMFQNRMPILVEKLHHFLSRYGISYFKFSKLDRTLKGLCLMDMWINTTHSNQKEGKLEELKSIIDRFKFLCVDFDDNSQEYQQLSDRVLRESSNGRTRSRQFDPNIKSADNYALLVNTAILDIINNHVDQAKSDFLDKNLLKLYPQFIRLFESSALYKESGLPPFKIKVLSLTSSQLSNFPVSQNQKLGWGAFYMSNANTGQSEVFVTYDCSALESTLEHEIIHALSSGSGLGIMENGWLRLMGRAMNEAFTEKFTTTPTSYPKLRYILDKIFQANPELEQLFNEVYFGQKDRTELLTAIFNIYGSEGLIRFDFMASRPAERSGGMGKNILYEPDECSRFFSKDTPDPYLDAIDKTKKIAQRFCDIYDLGDKIDPQKLDEKPYWDTNFGNSIVRIFLTMNYILNYNKDVPLKYLFEDLDLLDDYNNLLIKLEKFTYNEDSSTKIELDKLVQICTDWRTIFEKKNTSYWLKNNNQPLFTRRPTIKPSSRLTGLEFDYAYKLSQSMQGRNDKNPS